MRSLHLTAAKVAAAGLLIAVGSIAGGAPAAARLPAHPAPCDFTFGQESTEGAAGTQVLTIQLIPARPGQSCTTAPVLSDEITDAAGAVPAGIATDGGDATVDLLFAGHEMAPPVIAVAWSAYCTDIAQSVFLRISGDGQGAVYPLGISRPCSQGPGTYSVVQPAKALRPDPAVGVTGDSSARPAARPSSGSPAGAQGGFRIATASGVVYAEPNTVTEAGDGSDVPFVGVASDPNGGFWMVTADGGVYSYDGARFYGSTGGRRLAQPLVGIAASSDGRGYYLVAADGGVFTYGDARFEGSAAGHPLAAPVVGIAAAPGGHGYWLAAADGGVFAYGGAPFYGSAGSAPLSAAVVGITADRATGGYWLVAADGGVFGFHAPFLGSAGGSTLAAPVVGLAADSSYGGYWLVAADGGAFNYGNAPYEGSATSRIGA
ncbi:MAG TPA: hypothetical protein VG435_06765 [Acidimicrobiales bacterium]|jgi:hypothetical protein|nr:hypothetical protein [Acidimicrobiales bacterium]